MLFLQFVKFSGWRATKVPGEIVLKTSNSHLCFGEVVRAEREGWSQFNANVWEQFHAVQHILGPVVPLRGRDLPRLTAAGSEAARNGRGCHHGGSCPGAGDAGRGLRRGGGGGPPGENAGLFRRNLVWSSLRQKDLGWVSVRVGSAAAPQMLSISFPGIGPELERGPD